jgi:hypothetical protein
MYSGVGEGDGGIEVGSEGNESNFSWSYAASSVDGAGGHATAWRVLDA